MIKIPAHQINYSGATAVVGNLCFIYTFNFYRDSDEAGVSTMTASRIIAKPGATAASITVPDTYECLLLEGALPVMAGLNKLRDTPKISVMIGMYLVSLGNYVIQNALWSYPSPVTIQTTLMYPN